LRQRTGFAGVVGATVSCHLEYLNMARKPTAKAEFILFNVVYQDGSLSSNRKVPGNLVGTYEGDAPALAFIEAQDRDIAEKSGRPRGPIKRIERVR
jgi:hypothetical protein